MKETITEKTIKINVLLFGSLSELLNKKNWEVKIKSGSSIKDLIKLVSISTGKDILTSSAKPLLFAVNHNYATLETILKENDEVALMPFVSGG